MHAFMALVARKCGDRRPQCPWLQRGSTGRGYCSPRAALKNLVDYSMPGTTDHRNPARPATTTTAGTLIFMMSTAA